MNELMELYIDFEAGDFYASSTPAQFSIDTDYGPDGPDGPPEYSAELISIRFGDLVIDRDGIEAAIGLAYIGLIEDGIIDRLINMGIE